MYDFAEYIQKEITAINYLLSHYLYDEKMNGTLILSTSKHGFHYSVQNSYHLKGKKFSKKTPLGDQNDPRVIAFKRNRYNKELRKRLEYDLKLLEQLLEQFQNYDPLSIYQALPTAYRDIPDRLPESATPKELKEWARSKYASNPREFSDLANITAKGDKVRSKGEVIIYNILDFYGIPYRKELKLKLIDKDGHILYRYPDVVIPTISGRTIYWEHHGKLSDEEYMQGYLEKSELYYRNGLYLGDNLIITVDRPNGTMNAMMINDIVQHIILPQVKVIV